MTYYIKTKILPLLFIFVFVISSFLLPISLAVKPAIADSNAVQLTYAKPDSESFYQEIFNSVGNRKNIAIHTSFRDYSQFPDDLKDLVVKTEKGTFELNPKAKFTNYFVRPPLWGFLAGATCGVAAVITGNDPVFWSQTCATIAFGGGELLSWYKNNAKYHYYVIVDRGNIFLNVTY